MTNSDFCFIEKLIIFLSAIIAGMIVGMAYKKSYEYHGPNAKRFISHIYYNSRDNKCYQFRIKLIGEPVAKN